jgi:hypothetical protein
MSSFRIIVTAISGAILAASSFGLLLFGLDFSVVRLGEAFAETVGVIPPGWADSHYAWTVSAASIVTLPIVIAIFIIAWRQIFRIESALTRDVAAST